MSCGQSFAGGCEKSTASARSAQSNLSEVQQFVAERLRSWSLAGGPLTTILPHWRTRPRTKSRTSSPASSSVNAYRVLNADGSVPDEGMLNFAYRGVDLRKRLADEGIKFDADGHAAQEQRLTSEALKELLEARTAEDEMPASVKRAWMVRGTQRRRVQPRARVAPRRVRLAQRVAAWQPGPERRLRRAEAGRGDRLPAQVLRLPRAAARGARPVHAPDARGRPGADTHARRRLPR